MKAEPRFCKCSRGRVVTRFRKWDCGNDSVLAKKCCDGFLQSRARAARDDPMKNEIVMMWGGNESKSRSHRLLREDRAEGLLTAAEIGKCNIGVCVERMSRWCGAGGGVEKATIARNQSRTQFHRAENTDSISPSAFCRTTTT